MIRLRLMLSIIISHLSVIQTMTFCHVVDVTLCSVLDSIEVSETDIVRSINRLKTNSSWGPDGPPSAFQVSQALSQQTTAVKLQLMSVGAVPADWRTAYIVTVFMKGTAGDTANYRPISLTCVPSKILDRIVTSKIPDHLNSNNILCSAQHGFLKRRSTCTDLLECFNDWIMCVYSHGSKSLLFMSTLLKHLMLYHKKVVYPVIYVWSARLYYSGYKTFSLNARIKPKSGHVSQTLPL